jgi:tRNA G18 (ribose-2'-O)-methylase SpoU
VPAARVVPIEDPTDARLAELTGLTDAQARAVTEAEHGCFVVEGLVALETAVASAYPLRAVLTSGRKLDRVLAVVGATDVEVLVGSDDLLAAVTGFRIHRGVVASATRLPLPDPAALLRDAERVAVLEGITDHENLGALFRNAAAFGVDAVLLDPRTADPLYRRSVRVSLGHVLRVPWTRVRSMTDAMGLVRSAGFTSVALTPAGDHDVRDVRDVGAERIAWLLGTEGPGLTDHALQAADLRARIPMASGVDSLNVATAAAVAFALAGR